jgi:Cu/Zn superoxide dismutase
LDRQKLLQDDTIERRAGDSMSFKQELERRKAQKEQAAQQQADQQQIAIAKIESRAAEVAQHLKRRAEGMDGLNIHQEGARVTIGHKKSQERVFIDANTARYDLFREEPRGDGGVPQTVRESRRRVKRSRR